MKINVNLHKKPRKNRDLNQGVINNNKKSCLVDLKTLENFKTENHDTTKNLHDKASKSLKVRTGKNLGFGTYFQKLREDIVDTFLNYDEYISYEGMINCSISLPDLFNFNKEINIIAPPTTTSSKFNQNHSVLQDSSINNAKKLDELGDYFEEKIIIEIICLLEEN